MTKAAQGNYFITLDCWTAVKAYHVIQNNRDCFHHFQNILRKIKKSIKVRQNHKTLIFVYAYFLRTGGKNFLSARETGH